MKDVCIIGSGIAGSTLANLISQNNSVEIFDKAKGPGGRSSSRRYKSNLSFDHGLQYISPKDKYFKKFIINLKTKKVLKEWKGSHLDFNFKNREEKKYIGIKGNNDICKYLLKNIKVNYTSKVTNIKFNSNYWIVTINSKHKYFFKKLVFTCPFPQLKYLASKYLDKKILNLRVKMDSNITVMVVYKNYKKIPISSIKFNDNILAWAANENSKMKFKSKLTAWTIQASSEWSAKNINKFKKDKKKYANIILDHFEKLTGIQSKERIFVNIQGWLYAYNRTKTNLKCHYINKYKLGICGDWFIGSKAESAWLSSHSLSNKIIGKL